jgi:transposase
LPKGHLAYFVLDVLSQLDLRAIETVMAARDARGEKAYPPRLMVALLLYAYCTGMFSSRRIARSTYDDVAFRVIAAGEHPHFTTVNQFRLDHREALAALFGQVLQLCRKVGLVKLGHVAIDGSKVKANASKHKAMSYERMKTTDERLSQEISGLLDRADAVDAAEDAQYGVGQAPEDLPAELQRREDRQARIREAMSELEQEAAQERAAALRAQAEDLRAKAEDPAVAPSERKTAVTLAAKRDQKADALDDRDDQDDSVEPPSDPSAEADLPRHRVPTTSDGTPTPKAQRNFTDPDSSIMVRDGGFVQAYNAQIVVDEAHQIIVAEAVTNQPPDVEHLEPMLRRAIENCDAVPERVSADAGYFSEANILATEGLGSDPFIPPHRQRRGDAATPARPPTPMQARMRAKLDAPEGRAVYSRRKCIVEPVFGQIDEARGFRRFSLRSLAEPTAVVPLRTLEDETRSADTEPAAG